MRHLALTTALSLAAISTAFALDMGTKYPPKNGAIIGTGLTTSGNLAVSGTATVDGATNINSTLTTTGLLFVNGNSARVTGNYLCGWGSGSGTCQYQAADASSFVEVGSGGGTNERVRFVVNSAEQVRITSDTRIGIGVSAPVVALDVSSSAGGSAIRLSPQGAAPVACGSTTNGSLAMTRTTPELCYCNGTSWLQVDSGSACSW